MDLRDRQKALKLQGMGLHGGQPLRRIGSAESRMEGAKLACGEGVEGLETRGKLDGGEAALAKQPAQKIRGWFVTFVRVAFEAAHPWRALFLACHLEPPSPRTIASHPSSLTAPFDGFSAHEFRLGVTSGSNSLPQLAPRMLPTCSRGQLSN